MAKGVSLMVCVLPQLKKKNMHVHSKTEKAGKR